MSEQPQPNRPELNDELSADEFGRWYWTLGELQNFARSVGISRRGPKAKLTERVAVWLSGETPAPFVRTDQPKPDPMPDPLRGDSVIPAGQLAGERLRAYFLEEIGPTFTFDGHMRSFLKNSDGSTLDDAVRHWYETRGVELPEQSESLEFNRFTKGWHLSHPGGTPADARDAWERYKSLPVDQRPPVSEM